MNTTDHGGWVKSDVVGAGAHVGDAPPIKLTQEEAELAVFEAQPVHLSKEQIARAIAIATGQTQLADPVQRILSRLRDDVDPDSFNRYFRDQARVGFDGARLFVTVPNGFVADLVGRRFGDSLRKAARAELPGGVDPQVELKIRVDRSAFLEPVAHASTLPEPEPEPGPTPIRHRLEDFVVGESNRLAYSAAERLADPSGPRSFSPLFIHGACGLGKTHLLQGIAARWRERNDCSTVKYTTAEAFTNEYVQAVRGGRLDTFRRAYRGVDVLCIDDVQFLANKTSTQGELLHTFDAIDLDGARVVLASDEHPRQIARISAALVSRFMSGMVVRLDPPEPALRERIVAKMAERRALRLDEAAIAGSAHRIPTPLTQGEAELAFFEADAEPLRTEHVDRIVAIATRKAADEGASPPCSGEGKLEVITGEQLRRRTEPCIDEVEEAWLGFEMDAMLANALQRLDRADRWLLHMRHVAGRSLDEVSRLIGESESVVRKRYRAAMDRLRRGLETRERPRG